MTPLNTQTLLAAIALILLGLLGGAMVFAAIPPANATLLATVVGALAGALTVTGASHVAGKLANPPSDPS